MPSQYRWERPIAELIRDAEAREAQTRAALEEARRQLDFHERWAGRGFDWYPDMMKAWREDKDSHGTRWEHFLPSTVAEYAKAYREALFDHQLARRDVEILRGYEKQQRAARSVRKQSDIDEATRAAVRHTEERLKKRLAPTINRAVHDMHLGTIGFDDGWSPADDPEVTRVLSEELKAATEALAKSPSEEKIGVALTVVASTMMAGADKVLTPAVQRAMAATLTAATRLRVDAEKQMLASPSRDAISRVLGLSSIEQALDGQGSSLSTPRQAAEQLVEQARKALERDDSAPNRLRLQQAETLLQTLGGP